VRLPPGASEARPVGGGDINEAYRVVLSDGREAFVKTRADAEPGEYASEAAGLQWLAEPDALRVPEVLAVDEGWLALEWIERGGLHAAGEEELGRGLAELHGAGAPCFGSFRGADGERAWLGSLRLPNAPASDWPSFYAQRRLAPLARIAHERHALSAAGWRAVERVCERLCELCGPAEPPARLHGDLWFGNVLGDAQGRPWLIDPAAYGGHREVDLAMLALFGDATRTIAAYREVAPLAEGWEERVELYQLLPLLAHAALFGGSYQQSAERTAQRYA
jgi:fructosamine-3-kinase